MEETPVQATTRQQNFDYYINKLGLDSPRLQLLKGTLVSSPSSISVVGGTPINPNQQQQQQLENEILRKQMSPIPPSSRSISSPLGQQQQQTQQQQHQQNVSEQPYPYGNFNKQTKNNHLFLLFIYLFIFFLFFKMLI